MNAQERFAAMLIAMVGSEELAEMQQAQAFDEPDDWKEHDHTDYFALADYYDELAQAERGQ
jgi:hypothetical protein